MFVLVVVVMVVGMVVVMMGSLRPFVAALRQTGCHTAVVYFCFPPVRLLSRPPGFLSSPSSFRCASSFVVFGNSPRNIHSVHVPRRCQTRRCGCSVRVLLRRGGCTANATSQARKHPPEFTLYAWVVSSWPDMLGLRSLYRLRQRRIAALPIELRTDVQYGTMDRAIASLSVRAMSLHALMLFVGERSLMESIAIAIQLRHVRYWW